jgi:heavy metal translocating P-type ATPase
MVQVLHELPRRLRLRLKAADRPSVEAIAAAVAGLAGVCAVRANAPARCLIVAYDGMGEARSRILAIAELPAASQTLPARAGEAPDVARVIVSLAALLLAWLAPPPLKPLITVLNVAKVVARGVRVTFGKGLRVETLDATAITLPAVRGEYTTANTTRALLEVGSYIEATTVERSDALLRSLLRSRPESVWVERDGIEVAIPFASLIEGDRVVVATGETVAVDGTVVRGAALVDCSSVTGESLPIPKEPGDAALAGGVVTEGRLVVRAERIGAATTTGRITCYIQQALDRPAEIQSVSRELADKRVLITLASGAGVYLLTREWRRLASVFMVDYSCAVKLGTPIAIKAAMYRAARLGCLVKCGQALETLADVDTVVFDKTGTLTHATLDVTDIRCLQEDTDENGLLALVASVAEHTTHPIASAVVEIAHRRHLAHISHEEVDFIVGHGVASRVGNQLIRIGSRHYLEEDEGISFATAEPLIETLQAEGKALLYIASDAVPLGLVALKDRVRQETARTLERLRSAGVQRIVMMTGDHQAKALSLATTLKLDRIFWETHPEDKASLIEQLKADGGKVAFIGDGVNDGPALMAADISLAMPRAADIARAAADIVLMNDRLDGLADVHELARETMALIRGNFRTAVAANSGIMVGAALGKLSPLMTATLHNGTTIALLMRALTGTAFTPRHIAPSLSEGRS